MVMVKLKMRAIYKSFLSFIGFLILIAALIGVLYLFYDKKIDLDSDIEVTGNLSINYISGKKINVDDNLVIKFSITNNGNDVKYFNINFEQVRGSGDFKVLYNNLLVNEGKMSTTDEITTDYISIDSNETKLYSIEIKNEGNTPLKALLNIRKHESKNPTFADVILKNIQPSQSALTEVGVEAATENEGLIKSSDDVGVSYYFRGSIDNNYVSFGNMMWRIVRINGDGTVRLVLDGNTEIISSYYTSENDTFDYKSSNMNKYLENWLQENLSNYSNYIANTKFCSDIGYDDSHTYHAYDRIMTNKIPTFNCLGESFNNDIGLLTIDEVILAGASPTALNKDFYLYNSNIGGAWYTMTGARGTPTTINMFMIDKSGSLITGTGGDLYRYVRPVINLVKNIEMEGTGTVKDPYIMSK